MTDPPTLFVSHFASISEKYLITFGKEEYLTIGNRSLAFCQATREEDESTNAKVSFKEENP